MSCGGTFTERACGKNYHGTYKAQRKHPYTAAEEQLAKPTVLHQTIFFIKLAQNEDLMHGQHSQSQRFSAHNPTLKMASQ